MPSYHSKLNLDDYEISDMELDDQRHFNHIDCPAGTDTKRRLYIKRVEDGYIYFCHHCSKRGHVLKAGLRYLSAKRGLSTTGGAGGSASRGTKAAGISYPPDCEYTFTNWPRDARAWVRQYGISREEVKRYGLAYDITSRRVILPISHVRGLSVIQSRKIFSDDDRPKYITRRDPALRDYNPFNGADSSVCVLCEDILSAIKIARHADAYPLLSTNLQEVGLTTIIGRGYKKIFIWLDDDNRYVKRAQVVLKSILEMFVPEVVIIHTKGRDPKDHTDEEIKCVISKT